MPTDTTWTLPTSTDHLDQHWRLLMDAEYARPVAHVPHDENCACTRCFAADVDRELETLRSLLIEKNRAYGNSALDPLRLFSAADPIEQLKVRIDDKVSRVRRGAAAGEDAVEDWLGYLVLLRIAQRRQAAQSGLGEVDL